MTAEATFAVSRLPVPGPGFPQRGPSSHNSNSERQPAVEPPPTDSETGMRTLLEDLRHDIRYT